MSPFGKIVTIGIALVTGTAFLTGVTTAYMLRPAAPADTMTATYAPTPVRRAPAVVAPRVVPAVSRATVEAPRADRSRGCLPDDRSVSCADAGNRPNTVGPAP